MKKLFAVIGLGNFGYFAARSLYDLGHDVLAMDSDERKIERIKNEVTDARDDAVLKEFVGPQYDSVIVSLGGNMEASILCTMHLRDFGVKHIYVKALNDDHARVLARLGANDVIFPEREAAARLAQRLSVPHLIEQIPLAPDFSISQLETPTSFVNQTLKDLQLPSRFGIQVIAVKDILSDNFFMVPHGEFKLMPDSALLVIGRNEDLARLAVE